MAEGPCTPASQKPTRSRPGPERTPAPLTPNLRSDAGSQFLHAGGHLPDSPNRLRSFIWNADVEFVLQRKQDVDAIERIDLQLLKCAVCGDGFHRYMLRRGDHID